MLFKCTAFFCHILFFWWALSPGFFYGYFATVWFVDGNLSGLDGGNVGSDGGARPSLSLKSTVPIASGKGTRNSPYVVE